MDSSNTKVQSNETNDQAGMEDLEENSFICLIIKNLSDVYIRYDIMNSNLVLGIRKFLLDLPSEGFISNYDLVIEKNSRKLEDYETLFEVGLEEYDVIKMIPCNYTKTSSDFHLNRLTYILQECPPFLNKANHQTEFMSKDLQKLVDQSKKYYENISEFRSKILGEGQKEKSGEAEASQPNNEKTTESQEQPKPKDSSKKSESATEQQKKAEKEQLLKEKETVEETIKNYTETKAKVQDMDFRKFSFVNFQDSIIYEDFVKPQKLRCLNSIVKSVFNQFAKDEEKKGDLQYFEVNTLEGKVVYITSSEKGFFVNQSTASLFSNKPAALPCFSYTLAGVLAQISPLFRENFSKLISQTLNAESAIFAASPGDKFEWLAPNENPLYYNFRYKAFNYESENNRYTRLNKEWNEEFQAINDLNFNQDPIQNLSKEKLLNEFYKIFKDSAMEGVKLIREKKISSFNFFDNPRTNSGYYMFGNIFFTVLEDNYENFRTFTKEDQKQTYLGSNLDLRHINYLNANKHMLDLKDFYFSLNCIVQFKGLRVHAQVITPGVIFNSEHLVEYGEAEEGVIKYNEDFHENYKKFCEKLNIRELKVKDKNNKEFLVYGNPEIKGVRGVDKRKYLFDLNHLFPRDCNYLGEENAGCLLRPELIREYQMKLISQKISQDYQEEMKNINAEIEAAAQSAKDPQSYLVVLEEKLKKKEEIFEKISNEIKPDLVLDTTLFTETKLSFENANRDKDEALLRSFAKFLKEESIEKFIAEVSKEDENIPSDCFSLTEAVHRYGINIRYYGEILKRIESLKTEENAKGEDASNKDKEEKGKSSLNSVSGKNIGWIKTLIIRDLIRRAAKHLFNETTKDLPEYLVKEYSAYFLNLLLSPANLIKYLDAYSMEYSNGCVSAVKSSSSAATENSGNYAEKQASDAHNKNPDSKNKKKKNKNKKKKNKSENETEFDLKIQLYISDNLTNKALSGLLEPSSESIQGCFIKPSVFWNKLQEIIKKRYNYDFLINENFENIEHPINKYGLLRDFCLTVGLQIEATDFELYFDNSNKNDFKYALMPFKPENIVNFHTVCKDFYLPSEIHKPLFEQAEAMFKSGNLLESAEKFKQVVYLCNEVYGPINHYSAVAHKKLGEISYLEGDVMNAIHLIQKSIIIAEKMYNFDSSFVGNAYAELSTYFHMVGQDLQAFKYLLKSLEIIYFTYPRNHPDVCNRSFNLAMYYVDLDLVEKAKEVLEATLKTSSTYLDEDNKYLQRGWLLLAQLSLKSYSIPRSLSAYEKYFSILKKNIKDETIIANGEKIIEGLKIVNDEVKKKQNLLKNKEDSKRILDELIKKSVNRMFWEDLERPLPKYYFDANEQAYLNSILKKGMKAAANSKEGESTTINTTESK